MAKCRAWSPDWKQPEIFLCYDGTSIAQVMGGARLWRAVGCPGCDQRILAGHGRIIRQMSEAVEEGKELIGRSVASRFGVAWGGAGERSFFDGHVGVYVVAVGGLEPFVTEP